MTIQRGQLVYLIFNPSAGNVRGLTLKKISAHLAQYGVLLRRLSLESLKALALTPPPAGEPRTVMIVGGDGTLHRVLNAIGHTHLKDFNFIIVPAGTGNDFARSLDIPLDWQQALKLLDEGVVRPVDLGVINNRITFSCALSIGFGPEVTKGAKRFLRCLIGRGALYLSALLYLFRRKPISDLRAVIDRQKLVRLQTPHLVIGNARYHGGGFPITPDAGLQNHLLDMYYLAPLRVRNWWHIISGFILGKPHTSLQEVSYRQLREIRLRLNGPTEVDVDGDIYRFYRQLDVKVHPEALRVLMPRNAALDYKPVENAPRELMGGNSRTG